MLRRLVFLLRLMREHLWSYCLGTGLLAATLGMTFAIPRYLQEAIDILGADPGHAGGVFVRLIGWIVFFAVAIVVTRTGSRMLFFTPGRRVEFDLKNRLLAHLTRLQRPFYLVHPSGAVISRLNNDINGVRMLLGAGLMMLLSSAGTLSLAPVYMYQIAPRLTLYCAIPLALGFLLLQVGIRRLRRDQLQQMRSLQELSDLTVESYQGIDVLKAYRALGWAEDRFATVSGDVRDASIRMSTVRAYLMPLLAHIGNGLKVLLVLVGGLAVVAAEMTMGEFTAYTLYLSMLVPPLMGMTFLLFVLQRGFTSLGSLLEIFHTEPDLPPADAAAEARLPPRLREGLRVEGLTYGYPDDPGHPVLAGVELHVAPGEVVGVFGTVGSGKSTLVGLIDGYLRPPPGAVFLDGVDATRLGHARLRRHVVTVAQEPFLFSDTIRENITFGVEDVTADALARVVRDAALEPDLARMPAGLDTVVGERGITLSGGQKQRIALARALLKSADLLILDDVLSAVDQDTERWLVERIYALGYARSALLVSHRITALERADRIVVLDAGRVLAVGDHRALVARDGPYREAWRLQGEAPSDGRPIETGR